MTFITELAANDTFTVGNLGSLATQVWISLRRERELSGSALDQSAHWLHVRSIRSSRRFIFSGNIDHRWRQKKETASKVSDSIILVLE